MKCIIMAELETDAPLEALETLGGLTFEVSMGGMVWKPYVKKVHVFSAEEEEDEEDKVALPFRKKGLKALTPFNMGMHTGMSMVGSND